MDDEASEICSNENKIECSTKLGTNANEIFSELCDKYKESFSQRLCLTW